MARTALRRPRRGGAFLSGTAAGLFLVMSCATPALAGKSKTSRPSAAPPTLLGEFRVPPSAAWHRADKSVEEKAGGWVFDGESGRLALLRTSYPFRNEEELQAFIDDNFEALKRKHRDVAPATLTVAGVPSEVWRFSGAEKETVFYVVTYNGEKVFVIVIRAEGKLTALPKGAASFLSSIALAGRPWKDRRLRSGFGSRSGQRDPMRSGIHDPTPLVTLHEKVPRRNAGPRPSPSPKASPSPKPSPKALPSPSPSATPAIPEGLTGSAKRLAATIRGMQLMAAAEPASVPPFVEINGITPAQWTGAVSAAMEGMRLFYGDMTEEQEAHFEKRWRPLFDHPDKAVLDYCNKLNPLLGQFLATRTSLAEAMQDFDATQLEAAGAGGMGDAAGVTEAMEEAAIAASVLRSLQKRLESIGGEIAKLGEPPDAAAAQQEARRRHKKAFQILKASPIEGEWEVPGGGRVVYKIVRTFDDGLLLVYGGPKSQLEEARRKGISTSKPGVFNQDKGLLLIPGLWDLLEIWEPLGDGRFVTLSYVLVPVITTRSIDEDGNMQATAYTPGNLLNPKPSVGSWSATLVDPNPKEIPLLEGTSWKEVEELARTKGESKAGSYRKYKTQNARDYQDGLKPRESRSAASKSASASGAKPAAEDERKKREAEAAAATAKEQVAFHENNIQYFQKNMQSLEDRLRGEKNASSREAMERDLLYQKDAMQREQDQIASLRTGEYVRTRTDLDALNQEMMARQGRQEADKWGTIQRVLSQGPRLIARAPADEQDNLRDFFYRQLDGKAIASGDPEKFRRVSKIVGDKVIGLLENDAAKAEEKAVDASQNLAYVEKVKQVADTSMTLLSFGGGTPILMAYQGATGYIEGGIEQAVKQTISGYNTATIIANEAIEGYQHGLLDNLEQYANDPQKVKLDESGSGWSGAAWGAGEAAAMAAVMHLGIKALAGGTPPGANEPPGKRPTFKEYVAADRFRQDQEGGRALVRSFQEKMARVAEAGASKATREEILALRREAEQAYRTIKTDFHAKMQLNALGRAGDAKTIHYYQSFERQSMAELKTRFGQRMAADGWSEQQYKTFSNSASKGKVGMDIDLGAIEPPRHLTDKSGRVLRDPAGQPVPNPEHKLWRETLTQRSPSGLTFRRSPQELQKAGQRHLEEAFKEVYGRPPDQAFVNFTTSYHPEAYRDPAWLGKKGMKTANFADVDPKWVEQASDVTGFKVNNLPHEHPSFGYYNTLQEQCRGMAKDFETKLAPLLKDAKNPEAVKHLKELQDVMGRFARNEIGPIDADHTIRLLTGGEGMPGVADRFRIMLQGLKGAGAR